VNRTTRSLVAGMVAIGLLFLAIRVFLAPPWHRTVEGDGWRARLPMPSLSPRRITEDRWTLLEAVGSARFRVGTMPLASTASRAMDQAAAELHASPLERIPIAAIQGLFVLSGSGKRWRATLLFPVGDRLFRVESFEDRGNALEPLQTVAGIAASLEIQPEGAPAISLDEEDLEGIVGPAIARHLVGMDTVFVWVYPLLLLIFGLVFLSVRFAGRLPARPPGAPPVRLAEAQVSLDFRKGRWVRRQTVGAIALDAEGLHLYTMGREVATVPSGDLRSVQRVPGSSPRRPFEVLQGPLRIRFHPSSPEAWEQALVQG